MITVLIVITPNQRLFPGSRSLRLEFNKNAHDYRGPATLDYSINILFFNFAPEIFKAIVVVDYVYWK